MPTSKHVLVKAVKWECVGVLTGHKQSVTHCCVQEGVPDLRSDSDRAKYTRAFSCSKDGSVRVWQLEMDSRHSKLAVATSANSIKFPQTGEERGDGMNFCCVHKLSKTQWWYDNGTMIVACSDSLQKRKGQALPVNTMEFGTVRTDKSHNVPWIEWLNPNEDYQITDSSYHGTGSGPLIGHTSNTNCCCVHETETGEVFVLSCADDGTVILPPHVCTDNLTLLCITV